MSGTMSKAPLVVTLFLTIAARRSAARRPGPGGRGGTPTDASGECPAGMTEVRPGNCQAPSQPPPSIVDYRPTSTLVTEQHPVPKAKFPVIDIHGHPGNLATPEGITRVVTAMDALNIKVLVSADNQTGARLKATLDAIAASPHKDRFRVFCGIDLESGRPGLGRAGREAARGRRRRRRGRRRRDLQGLRPEHPEGRRLAPEGRRSRARSDLAGGGPPRHPGVHPHRRAAGVLRAARLPQRALAGAGALPGPRRHRDARRHLRGAGGRAQPPVRAQPEDALHRRALRLARQRPRQGVGDARRLPERRHRGRRDPLRHRPPAARRARLLRQVPGPHPVRQGLVPAGRVSVLLARVRDEGRVLRLLPRLPRVLEAVRHRPARTRC